MLDIQSATVENRRGKKKKEEIAAAKCNDLSYWAALIMVALCNRADHYIFAL